MTATPRPNYFLRFDGVDDRVFNVGTKLVGIDYVTVGVWLRYDRSDFDGVPGSWAIVNKGPSRSIFLALIQTTGDVRFEAEYTLAGTRSKNGGPVDLEVVGDKKWHYFVCTFDGVYIRWYLDGALYDTSAPFSPADTLNVAVGNLILGQLTAGGYAWYKGDLGPCHIYDRALSLAEIQYNYRRPNRPTMSGTVWEVNQDNLDDTGVWVDDSEATPHEDGLLEAPAEILTNPLKVDVTPYP